MLGTNLTRKKVRYQKGVVTPYNYNIVEIRNPTVIMWWSAALPGFGHVMLCRYLKGFILIIWEFAVNVNANINTAIVYTFTGRFEDAVQVVDVKWVLLYIPVYMYAIWDSRRVTIDLNKYAILADQTPQAFDEINPITITGIENNYLDKRKPWLALFWSFITPGLGHLYINRLPSGFYILIWFLIVLYFANFLPAIHHTFIGEFHSASNILHPQWILFLPSIYGYAAYASYLQCESYNKLMVKQQSNFLMNEYQNISFKEKISLFSERSGEMNVVASFDHTVYLELAIKELEKHGISKENIFTVPLTEKIKQKKNSEIIRGSGFSLLDMTFSIGTVFSLFGVIYGFVLSGGPILWGLIGLFVGCGAGFLLDLFIRKKQFKAKKKKGEGGEVVLVIHCNKDHVTLVKEILFDHFTLGLQVIEDEYKDIVY
ncbi:hypothetical protein [Alkalihalobacterium elongatum]|uniref:hypothetical protein n=1 Tax=Alkalihalobacterium elongatum TaxID=2675466 RepID=UPI001C1F98EF|nr:hypothetical protein [Alkalihalobacterium elongatum]